LEALKLGTLNVNWKRRSLSRRNNNNGWEFCLKYYLPEKGFKRRSLRIKEGTKKGRRAPLIQEVKGSQRN